MSGIRGWLLFAALLSLSVTAVINGQDDVEDHDDFMDIVEKAFLLVRHKIDTVELVQGKNTSVVVEIYNAGNRYRLKYLGHSVVPACSNSNHLAVNSTSLLYVMLISASVCVQCCHGHQTERRRMAPV